jgi:hypothetical protein
MEKPASPVLNTGHSLATDLDLAWLFVEGSGTAIEDFSGNGHDGTVLNAVPTWETGDYGAELALDGTNDRVKNDSDSLPAYDTAARSLMLVFNNRTTTGVNVFGAIGNVSAAEYTAGGRRFGWYANGVDLNFWNSDGSGDTLLMDNTWTTGYHILIGTKPSTASGGKTYVDNDTAINHNNYVGNTKSGFFVGVNDTDVGNDWHPEIDIVAAMVWGRELTVAEVGELMDDPFVHFRVASTVVKDPLGIGIIPFAR